MTEAVTVRGLQFAYPDGRVALRGVDLSIGEGERVALLGPNGAGKTTLALHLNGVYSSSAGTVSIGGIPVVEANLGEIRRQVGLVFQDSNDQLFMPTVGEDVAFGPANLGLDDSEVERRVGEALALVGGEELEPRPPHHLSGGEKRRAALATVLSMSPGLLVIDEPSVGLDPAGRREVIERLGNLVVTQLIITHDLPLALELCPRTVIMNAGKVVADGPTGDILGDADLLAANRLELPYRFSPDPRR